MSVREVSAADLFNAFSFSSSGTGFKKVLSGLSGVKNAASSVITQKDIDNITAYNAEIENGVSSQTAWYHTMQTSSKSAKDLVEGANGAKVATSGLTVATNTSRIAMVGLKVAAVALNMALTIGLSYGIQKLIEGLDYLANYEEKAAEKAKEQANKSREAADAVTEESNKLNELINRYKELKSAENIDAEGRAEIRDIQSQISDLVGSQVDNLDLVNGKLDEELDKLYEIQNIELSNNLTTYKKAYTDSRDATNKYDWKTANWYSDLVYSAADLDNQMITIDYWGDNENRNKALEIINEAWKKAGYGSAYKGEIGEGLDTFSVLSFDDSLNMQERLDALDSAIEALENAEDFDYLNNGLWEKLVDIRNEIGGTDGLFTKQIDAANDFLNNLTQQTINNGEKSIHSLDEYRKYRQEIIDSMLDDETIKQTIDDGVLTEQDIESSVDMYLGTLSKYEEYYDKYNAEVNKLKNVESITDILLSKSGLKKVSTEFIPPEFTRYQNNISEFLNTLSGEDVEIGKMLVDNGMANDLETLKTTIEGYKNASEEYDSLLNEVVSKGIDTSKTVFGNIDTNNRQILNWNDNNLSQYKTAIESWGHTVDELKGAQSTVMGASGEFNGLKIAFSPILQTEDGAMLLDKDTVSQYIGQIVNEAGADDSYDDILELDAKGITIEGKKIKNLIADIGDTADETAENMHYLGNTGALQMAYNDFIAYMGAIETIDIADEIEAIENLNNAISQSYSSSGMTTESIQAIEDRLGHLKDYDSDKLFSKTTAGVRLNIDALNELEEQYESIEKTKLESKLNGLIGKYEALSYAIDNVSMGSAKYVETMNLRDSTYEEIQALQIEIAQFKALTSAYNKWQSAKEAGNYRDEYSNLGGAYESYKEMIDEGWSGDDELSKYLDLMLNVNDRTKNNIADFDKLTQKIEGTNYSIMDFFKYDEDGDITSDGLFNFLDAAKSKLGEEYVSIGENGLYSFDFTGDKIQEVADALGMSTEAVRIFEDAMIEAGFDVQFDDIDHIVKTTLDDAQESLDTLKSLKSEKLDGIDLSSFNFKSIDINDITNQISEAEELVDKFRNKDGTINLDAEGAKEARDVLVALVLQKQRLSEPEIMDVDTTALSKIEPELANGIFQVQEMQKAFNTLELQQKLKLDTSETESSIQSIIAEINAIEDEEIRTKLGLDSEEVQTAIKSIDADINAGVEIDPADITTIQSTISGIDLGNLGISTNADSINSQLQTIDQFQIQNKSFNVTANGAVVAASQLQTIIDRLSNIKSKDVYVNTYETKYIDTVVTGEQQLKGSAYASGTAFKQGSWGTKNGGTALFGELGQELIVDPSTGTWHTVGDNGAEFAKYKKGSIIFNARQTRELLKYGKIISGTRRGYAYASGTAFADGASGSGGKRRNNSNSSSSGSSSGSSSSSKSSSSSSSSSKAEDFEEIFDWIEIAIDRIERAIDRLDLKVGSTYRSWKSRNKNLKSEIGKVTEEISLQEKAYDRYIKEANSVGLSDSWAKKVREGKVDIETITNEDLADKVQKYQDWYEKAVACKDSIDELNESLGELYETAFSNKQTEWEQIIGIVDHESSMIEEFVNQSEANGYVISTQYYQALIDREKTNIDNMTQERDDLLLKLKEGLESGAIEQGSETYYNMLASINEVTLGIEESNSEIKEFSNNIRDIEWEVFDLIQNKIANVTKEADFLIDLMDDSKLFDNKGQLTNTGLAVMGLHGQNYNVAMAQADQYAQEMLNIDKQLAEDPYNQDLIERRQELLELQQDSILAAESEKLAIKDMVAEGIDLELEALSDLIDKYEESLDAQKNLYDYQKKIKEQTSEIASLQKQLTAYAGDTSEETKAKVQKLEVSLAEAQEELQETQYDHFISDSKKMLDEMYTEYEEILNARLDDIDALLSDMIEVVNDNSSSINQTLIDQTANVGYTLSQEMSNIWNSSNGVNGILTTYGDNFTTQLTSVNVTLSTINVNVQNMIEQLNKIAGTNINAAKDSNASNSEEAKATKVEPPTPPSQNKQPVKQTTKTIEIGGKINAKGAKIYTYAGGSGSSQYFASDPIYTVLDEKNGYLLVRWHKLSSGQTGWFKKSDVKAYKTGVKNLDKNQLAWTQEDGLEAIIRPSDGAILTPLERKDTVLTNGETSNILSMANNPSGFIRDNLFDSSSTDSIKTHSINNKTEVNFDNIHLVLPNVKNYDEFLYALQHDNKFEKIVRAMTTDKIFGGSILKKYKY